MKNVFRRIYLLFVDFFESKTNKNYERDQMDYCHFSFFLRN